MQYLYDSGDEVVFMDEGTFEQLSLPHALIEDELPFMQPSSSVQVMFVGGNPSGVDLPSSVVLEVTETEPGVKGDTVSNVTKPATLETGAVIQVPLFVNVGDKIKLDPQGEALHPARLGRFVLGCRRRLVRDARRDPARAAALGAGDLLALPGQLVLVPALNAADGLLVPRHARMDASSGRTLRRAG